MIPISYILSAVLQLTALINLGLAYFSFKKRTLPGGTSLSVLFVAISIYCAGYGMEIAASHASQAHFWLHMQYFGVPFLPALILITIFNILFQRKTPTHAIVLLFIVPAITFLLQLTNKHHHLYYSSIQFISNGSLKVLVLGKGPWYWVQTAYLNLAFVLCMVMSIMRFVKLKGQLKKISSIIITSLLFPWAGHIIYIIGANPTGVDTAPFTLSITMLIIAYAFSRQRFLDILPMAYDALFHNLPDGVLVVDENGIVVGHNASVEKILDTHIAGMPTLHALLPILTETCNQDVIEGNCLIEKKINGKSRWIDVRGSIFLVQKNLPRKIITLRDITEMKTMELAIKDNEKKMRDEIVNVRNIQAALMPDFKDIKNYDISCIYLPVGNLSGDFIDGYFINDETFQIVICDVMGHGLASAYLGMEIRSLFRAISPGKLSPASILTDVNRTLALDFSNILYFATAAVVHINTMSNAVIYSSAGHPASLHLLQCGDIRESAFAGPLMGLHSNNEYKDISFNISRDEYFLMYTDGITEAREKGIGEMFEKERLKAEFAKLKALSSRDALHSLINTIFEYIDYTPIEDDISLVCFRLHD